MIETTAVQYSRVDAKDSIEMGKTNLVINANTAERSSKSRTEILARGV